MFIYILALIYRLFKGNRLYAQTIFHYNRFYAIIYLIGFEFPIAC